MGILSLFQAGHCLKYAHPSRSPPSSELFPFYMQNAQGLWLRYTEYWPRVVRNSSNDSNTNNDNKVILKGVVFIVSGLGEYSGRYDSVALRLNKEGYVAFTIDNQGAGGSEGVRLYVEKFEHFVNDVEQFIHFILAKYENELSHLPRVLLGHSMGGLISTLLAMRLPDNFFHAVVLSGPAYASCINVNKVEHMFLRFASKYIPKLPLLSINADFVSRNEAVVQLVEQDPFYCNAKLRARFVYEIINAQNNVFSHIKESTNFPFFIVHGEDDKLCKLSKSVQFYREAMSKEKLMKTYAKCGHEVLTEVNYNEVMQDVIDFINKRCLL